MTVPRSLLLILLLLGVALVGAGGVASDEGAPKEAPYKPQGNSFEVGFTVNNLGYIDVCGCKRKKVRMGSVARRQSLLKQLRARGHVVTLLDGGNCFFHNDSVKFKDHEKKQAVEKAKVVAESMNRMGYQAMTLGPYDLSLGIDVLRDLEKMSKFPFLCANLVDESGKTLFPPTHEFSVEGTKIGVLGLTLATLQPYYLEKRAPGSKVTDPIEAAKKLVPGLRERNDVVILLSHNKADYNVKLAKEVPGIDFIIDPFIEMSNHKLWLEDDELLEHVGSTLIARTDSQGARLGVLDIDAVAKGAPFVDRQKEPVPPGRSSYSYTRVSIEPHLLEDPEIQLLVDTFKKGTSFVNTEVLPDLPHKDKYLTASTCQACHVDQYNFWKSTKHADAFASLEETNDQWRQDCIACHVLGYGQTFVSPADAEPYKNVQCESCHGLNPQHPTDPAAHQWPRVQEKSCLTCHNKRQTLSDFNFHGSRRKVACPPLER